MTLEEGRSFKAEPAIGNATSAKAAIMPALPAVMKSLPVGLLTASPDFRTPVIQNGGSEPARERGLPEQKMLSGPTSSRAGSLPQGIAANTGFVSSPQVRAGPGEARYDGDPVRGGTKPGDQPNLFEEQR
jgi:hypothetical protein